MEGTTFTQEQVDQMIADAKKGLITPDEFDKKLTAEVDRRVETGINKGLETYKTKWEQEFMTKSKMTAEELAKKEIEERLAEFKTKEVEISKRANMIDAKDMLSEAGVPKAHYEKFIGMLVTDDGESTKSNVSSFVEMFNSTKTDIESKLKAELSKVPAPQQGKETVVDRSAFDKMTYAEKIKFKETNPELYKQFIG